MTPVGDDRISDDLVSRDRDGGTFVSARQHVTSVRGVDLGHHGRDRGVSDEGSICGLPRHRPKLT